MSDAIEDVFDNIQQFVEKAKVELRTNLKVPAPGESIGLSCAPEMTLTRMPEGMLIKRGLYDSCCGRVHVEVLGQHPVNSIVFVQIYDEPDKAKRFAEISPDLFGLLFQPKAPIAYVLGKHD